MRIHLLFRTLAIVLVSSLYCLVLAQAAGADSDFVGLSSDDVFAGSPGYRADNLRREHDAGVRLLRQNFDWASIERSPGRYQFAYHDEYMAATARAGLQVLPVLYNAPRFHSTAPRRGAKRGLYLPRRSRSMGRF